MKRRAIRYWMLLPAFAAAFSFAGRNALAQSTLTPQEIRGRQIYTQGTSASGKEILAYIGDSALEVPGNTMPCANCHATRGLGKPEGGIDPSNITWEALTKPYGVTHTSGRKHPAYTERGLELAITRGVDPAGNRLLAAMPRYQMTREDLADLVVYLKRLGTDTDPGVADNRIVIGTAVPSKGPLLEMGQAVKDVLVAAFAEVNAQGGIYGRQVELKFVETGENAATARANIDRLIKDEKVFAMTGVFLAGVEKEVTPLFAEQEVPLVGPLTLEPKTGTPLNRQVFYLMSGNSAQARAMISFLAKQPDPKDGMLAVVHTATDLNASVIEAVKSEAQKDRLPVPIIHQYTAGTFDAAATVKQLSEKGIGAVLLLGSTSDLTAFMTEADKANWFPQILLQSGVLDRSVFDAPAGFENKLFFTLPTSPDDHKVEALTEYRLLTEKYKLQPKHQAAQLSAYAAAKLLIEGLKRVGRDLSRERLIQVLEGFYEYQTGLTPPITWGPNRRIGAMGAYVVRVDLKGKQFVPASGWIGIN
ncbi:MAG TPA: ABC transporter substrate-binding protein [Pyrinomonadaceae bacterium]|jgi:ABC-type branched-subunit amino acid transport system substrate-binding protein|nr:ABC transporter substrate-binding protein [Pyrinomonadaceae bacterium]